MSSAAQPSSDPVLARLNDLERKNRQLGWLMIVLVAVCMTVLFAAAQAEQPRTVEAQKFVVVDASGKTKAVLEATDAITALKFFDEKSRPVAELSVSKDGPALGLQSASGESLTLSATKESTGMAVVNAKTQIAVALGVAKLRRSRLHPPRRQRQDAVPQAVTRAKLNAAMITPPALPDTSPSLGTCHIWR